MLGCLVPAESVIHPPRIAGGNVVDNGGGAFTHTADDATDTRRSVPEAEQRLNFGEAEAVAHHRGAAPDAHVSMNSGALSSVGFLARLWGMVRGLGRRPTLREDD